MPGIAGKASVAATFLYHFESCNCNPSAGQTQRPCDPGTERVPRNCEPLIVYPRTSAVHREAKIEVQGAETRLIRPSAPFGALNPARHRPVDNLIWHEKNHLETAHRSEQQRPRKRPADSVV